MSEFVSECWVVVVGVLLLVLGCCSCCWLCDGLLCLLFDVGVLLVVEWCWLLVIGCWFLCRF